MADTFLCSQCRNRNSMRDESDRRPCAMFDTERLSEARDQCGGTYFSQRPWADPWTGAVMDPAQ